MQSIEVTKTFAGTPEAVWDENTNHVGWGEWGGVGGAGLEREGDPAPNGVGCIRVIGPGPFAACEETLRFEPPKPMTYTILRGGIPMRNHIGEVWLKPEGDRTRIVWHCRFESKIPGLGWLFERIARRVFVGVLDGLAREHFPERLPGRTELRSFSN